ncbi:Transcriptional regulator, MarR family [Methanosarcina horonobensis HB-1 = JCM 15518]|uniref:Transcriptional regulator, MarR family n=2 Tax=Methanosarcina horonobensis TaxID=418008 RepID=A0A0E3SBY4_9EURY|nr:MarR family transcriptional regulator [Methanosarcina horonobensis]AKB78366.1 Transcriptional regulator, MarR family [Methanosarcina horonobensis HB-1 = JCM 15518]
MYDKEKTRESYLLLLEREMLYNKLIDREIFQRISRAKLEGLENLSKQQPTVIMIIGTVGEVIPSYLGLCMNLDRSSLSRMVDSLEKKEIVKRRIDPEDRRKVLISLTEKGERYYQIILGIIEEIHASVIGFLGEQDIERYEACLKTEVNFLRIIDSRLEAGE